MPTNNERREVAARLRKTEPSSIGTIFDAIREIGLCVNPGGGSFRTLALELADLIEPEPERTCRNMADEYDGLEFVCSECTRAISEYEYAPEIGEFCPSCGAKVVE